MFNKVILCQEGYCTECQIWLDFKSRVGDVAKTNKRDECKIV
jgi:hypothetical protein